MYDDCLASAGLHIQRRLDCSNRTGYRVFGITLRYNTCTIHGYCSRQLTMRIGSEGGGRGKPGISE